MTQKSGEFAKEVPPNSKQGRAVTEIILALNEAVPDGSNAGDVMGAIGALMLVGMGVCHKPKDRLKAFDEWIAWHRGELIKKLN